MITQTIILFLILIFGIVLFSFLGANKSQEGMTGNFTGTFETNSTDIPTTSNINNSTNGTYNGSNVYDNYNHFNGSSTQLPNGTTFYGSNGGSVVVTTNSDGSQTLLVTFATGQAPITFTSQPPPPTNPTTAPSTSTEGYTNYYGANGSATTYYGPNGGTATIVNTNNGQEAVNVQTQNGAYTFTQSGSYYNPNNTNSTQYYGSTGYKIDPTLYSQAYYGPYGGSAGAVTGPNGNTAYYAQGPNGNTVAGTTNSSNPYVSSNQYYGPYGGSAGAVTGPNGNTAYYAQGPNGNTVAGTTNSSNPYVSSNQYYGPYGGSAGAVTGPNGNTAYYAQGPNGNTVAGTTNNSEYYSSLPPGIPASQISPGNEDLYILKSEIVPPVCPACPTSSACPREEPCPACPACARCPEPSFECKKVPNYNSINEDYLPTPVLNDFSQFGM